MQNKETEIEFNHKCDILLKPLTSVDDLQNWLHVFLDLYFPKGTVYPDSTHGPADAMWRIYELMSTGKAEDVPQVCMLASRDSFKTLGAAALEVLCVLHFKISVAHMAAISSQSDKAIQYINAFFRKLKPYLEHNGWKQSSDNKKMIAWLTEDLQEVYIRIVIATIAGANCIKGNTSIRTNLGAMRASDLFKRLENHEDIKLLSYNHSNQSTEYKSISNRWQKKHNKLYKIKTTKGTIEVSGEHKIFVEGRGYVKAQNLSKGMKVLRQKADRDPNISSRRLNIESIRDVLSEYSQDVSLVSKEYKNNTTDLEFNCSKHGTFKKKWNKCQRNVRNHSSICPSCNIDKNTINQKLTLDKIREHVKDNEFVFVDISDYSNANKTKLKLSCKKDHTFFMSVNNFRNDPRCTKCNVRSSKAQEQIRDYIKEIYNGEIVYNTKNIINPMELDIYIPEARLGIELDGLYWHSSKVRENANKSNIKKKKLCTEKDIDLFVIFEDEWRDKRDLVKAMIRFRLGIKPKNKLRASKLEIRKLDKNKEYSDFFEKFHLDGHTQSSFALGLFHEDKMISCASFRRSQRDNCFEISRFASNYNYHVYGSLGKILKNFFSNNDNKLISYSNNRLSNGNIYKKLKFKEVTVTKEPSYYYTDFDTRIFRTKCQRINDEEIIKKYPTEREQALGGVFSLKYLNHNKPLYRIYDYGHRKWIIE